MGGKIKFRHQWLFPAIFQKDGIHLAAINFQWCIQRIIITTINNNSNNFNLQRCKAICQVLLHNTTWKGWIIWKLSILEIILCVGNYFATMGYYLLKSKMKIKTSDRFCI